MFRSVWNTCVASLLLAVILPNVGVSKVGETLEQCIARYGEQQRVEPTDTALYKRSKLHAFSNNGLRVVVEILGGDVVATTLCREKSPAAKKPPAMQRELIEQLLKDYSDGVGWQRIAANTTVSNWTRRDGKVSAVYDPLDYHLVLYAKEVDESAVEEAVPPPSPTPSARAVEVPVSIPSAFSLPETLTIGGITYQSPVYRSHDEWRLNIAHETGAASIRIASLSPDLQEVLGFDRQAAAIAEEAFAEKQRHAAMRHTQHQIREAEKREELAKSTEKASESADTQAVSAQAGRQRLDLSHRSLSGGPALEPDAIAANLFDLKGRLVRVEFRTTDHRAVRQTSDGFYELNVLPDGCNAVVRVPVDIGRKWFAPRNNKYYPRRFIVRVDVGDIENVYGTVREGAILVAVGTKVRRGMGGEGSWVEW